MGSRQRSGPSFGRHCTCSCSSATLRRRSLSKFLINGTTRYSSVSSGTRRCSGYRCPCTYVYRTIRRRGVYRTTVNYPCNQTNHGKPWDPPTAPDKGSGANKDGSMAEIDGCSSWKCQDEMGGWTICLTVIHCCNFFQLCGVIQITWKNLDKEDNDSDAALIVGMGGPRILRAVIIGCILYTSPLLYTIGTLGTINELCPFGGSTTWFWQPMFAIAYCFCQWLVGLSVVYS